MNNILSEDYQNYAEAFTISPDMFSNIVLTEAYKDNTPSNRLFKFCNMFGLSFKDILSTISLYSNKVIKVLSTEGLNPNSTRKINRIADEFWTEINENLKYMDYSNNEKFLGMDKDKVNKAISVLFVVLIVQTILGIIFNMLFGQIGGTVLLVTILAPITEENAKMVAIKGGFIGEFTAVFNGFEFTNYVLSGSPVTARLAAVGMHLTTTLIQYFMRNTEVLDKIDSPEQDRRLKAQMTGHTVGMLIHTFWNLAAIIPALTALARLR